MVHSLQKENEGITPCHLLAFYVDGAKDKNETYCIGAFEHADVYEDLVTVVALQILGWQPHPLHLLQPSM